VEDISVSYGWGRESWEVELGGSWYSLSRKTPNSLNTTPFPLNPYRTLFSHLPRSLINRTLVSVLVCRYFLNLTPRVSPSLVVQVPPTMGFGAVSGHVERVAISILEGAFVLVHDQLSCVGSNYCQVKLCCQEFREN
jgi:hypothetical protein